MVHIPEYSRPNKDEANQEMETSLKFSKKLLWHTQEERNYTSIIQKKSIYKGVNLQSK